MVKASTDGAILIEVRNPRDTDLNRLSRITSLQESIGSMCRLRFLALYQGVRISDFIRRRLLGGHACDILQSDRTSRVRSVIDEVRESKSAAYVRGRRNLAARILDGPRRFLSSPLSGTVLSECAACPAGGALS